MSGPVKCRECGKPCGHQDRLIIVRASPSTLCLACADNHVKRNGVPSRPSEFAKWYMTQIDQSPGQQIVQLRHEIDELRKLLAESRLTQQQGLQRQTGGQSGYPRQT